MPFSRHFASRLLFDLGACHGQLRTDSYLGAQSSKFGFSGGDFHHGHGRFYDDRQSARRFGKTTKFVGNCGDVMRCPVNLETWITRDWQYLLLQLIKIDSFMTRTLSSRFLPLVLFFPGHWFDPLVWPSRITRVNGSKRNVSWIWKLWVTLLNVSMLTWSASFFSRKCINFVEAKLKQHLIFFVPKPFRQDTTWAFWRVLKGILGWHFTRNPPGFPALLSGWFSFSFLRRPDFGAGVPGNLVCAPGMKLRWFGQTTWVVSLDWRKTTPKFEGIEDLWMRFWGINGSYW